MTINREDVESFFSKYEAVFADALKGHVDLDAIKALYSEHFIAATPRGVLTAAFDGSFEEVMSKGYERYRELGTKGMQVESIDTHDIDDNHILVRVRWHSTYQKPEEDEIHIPFDVNYLLQQREGQLKVFGWITGDEEALLKAHRVI